MKRSTIILFANRLPVPVDDGWKRRTFHVIRALTTIAPVQLIVFGGPGAGADQAVLGPLVTVHAVRARRFPKPLALAASLLLDRPLQQLLHYSTEIDAIIASIALDHHIVAAGCASVFLADYLSLVRAVSPRCYTFVDTHNIDSLYYRRLADTSRSWIRRMAFRHTAYRTEALEHRVFPRVTETWVCSTPESKRLSSTMPEATVRVIANGADVPRARTPDKRLAGSTALFFGRLDYEPNADAVRLLCRDIWPIVRKSLPSATLRIVGSGDTTALLSLISRDGSIDLAGRVEDIAAELDAVSVVVVPLRSGGGTRLKILEAMAAGCAVVTTTIGGEGIALEDEEHALIRDAIPAFAEAIVRLLRNHDQALRIGRAAQELVLREYEWGVLEADIASAIRSHL